MILVDEISSRGNEFRLTQDDINDLLQDETFIADLRLGVQLMVRSWGWVSSKIYSWDIPSFDLSFSQDIEQRDFYQKLDGNQKWSQWPVRLYKAGKCMWLFGQDDYYHSLKDLANHLKEKEKLDFYSHTVGGKADVLEEWSKMERNQQF